VAEVWRTRADGAIATARYTDAGFAALEHDRLWSRVWQIAGREEQVRRPGDVLEYRIGDASVLIARDRDGALHAMRNACRHRGSQLVQDHAHVDGCLRCPYHGWTYELDGRLRAVVDPDDFGDHLPEGLRLAPVAVDTFGGFVFVHLTADAAPPLSEFLGPIVGLLAPYRLDRMRLRLARTTVLPANWKAVIDAFNEGYHVQGLHPQILPWTDDTAIAYEQFDVHARYGRLPGARRTLRPSPRLAVPDAQVDELAILEGLVHGLGGAFLRDERAIVEELRRDGPPVGTSLLAAFQTRRRALMTARGFDVSAFADDELTSAQDVFWFPNVVGPIYPGSAILFRVRPGPDPHTAVNDTWVLEWPDASRDARPPRVETVDWREFAWDPVTQQDYDNLERVQRGMRDGSVEWLFPNPRQEGNVVHLHRVLDRYLFD
jgi:phenylpropionate dioxygenase-like ring-hydroxylating dioxygenase large terminal subunit